MVSLKRINHLLDKHITADDGTIFEAITGTSLQELRHALTNAPNVTVDRFLSADRWVHSEVRKKTALFEPFIYKRHLFTKTGSGRT